MYTKELDTTDHALLGAQAFHLFGMPLDVETFYMNLSFRRVAQGYVGRYLIVWEPPGIACEREELDTHCEMLAHVSAYSITVLELWALTGKEGDPLPEFSYMDVERRAQIFVDHGIGVNGDGVIVIRCGRRGYLHMRKIDGQIQKGWVTQF